MPEKLLTDKQWRAMHGWDDVQAENKRLKDNMAAASKILDAYFCAFPRNGNKEDELVVEAKRTLKNKRLE